MNDMGNLILVAHHEPPVMTSGRNLIPMSEGTVQEAAYVGVAFGLLRDDSVQLPLANPLYAWDPGHPKGGKVYNLTDLPPEEVSYLTQAQITAFGASVGVAGDAWLAQLPQTQVAAIATPNTPYWVGRLSAANRRACPAVRLQPSRSGA